MEALDDAGGDAAANAILTTDLVDKPVALELELDGRRVCIGGMAKGSGMIPRHGRDARFSVVMPASMPAFGRWCSVQCSVPSTPSPLMETPAPTTPCWPAAGPPLPQQRHAILEQGLTQAMQQLAQAIAGMAKGDLSDRGAGRGCSWRGRGVAGGARSVVRPW